MTVVNDAAPGRGDLSPSSPEITARLTLLFAAAVGIIVINLFVPQTLVGLIGPSLGLGASAASLVAMATLLGYACGLLLLVPLADLIENRRLTVRLLTCAVIAAAVAAVAPTALTLLLTLFALGAACSAIQIIVPIAAAMAPPERRGQVIGDVMSGLMIGILLSRPFASLVADLFGWRAFYGVSAMLMVLLTLALRPRLPQRQPQAELTYPALIASLWQLLRSEAVLRQKALSAALGMAAFSLFWTAIALRLVLPPFDLGQRGIALFALAGAVGAVLTPLFGRAGDRGWTRPVTIVSHLVLIAGAALAAWAGSSSVAAPVVPLVLMAVAAFMLDVGVVGAQTLGRRAVNLLQAEARGRINGIFVGVFFLGASLGSAIAGLAWTSGGWPLVCAGIALFGGLALWVDSVGKAA
ncbi:MFS transporter [Afipia sp. P52-10]|uniref:MFS transporter n=1 Tax=Afipia sp. P52-10 TaxID=1429916 RepID=UPI0003DF361A|nr:MFS transporter [Afipia sp. P52-10]ETR77464.1 MFS transporter [Afipia sp. P52-10]